MVSPLRIILTLCCLVILFSLTNAQILSLGAKYQEKFMFQATLNRPFIYDKKGFLMNLC